MLATMCATRTYGNLLWAELTNKETWVLHLHQGEYSRHEHQDHPNTREGKGVIQGTPVVSILLAKHDDTDQDEEHWKYKTNYIAAHKNVFPVYESHYKDKTVFIYEKQSLS